MSGKAASIKQSHIAVVSFYEVLAQKPDTLKKINKPGTVFNMCSRRYRKIRGMCRKMPCFTAYSPFRSIAGLQQPSEYGIMDLKDSCRGSQRHRKEGIMKVLIINGSPRAEGNTSIAIGEMEKIFIEEGIETETVQIGHKDKQSIVPL